MKNPQNPYQLTAQEAIEELEEQLAHPQTVAQQDGEIAGVISDKQESHAFVALMRAWWKAHPKSE